MLNNVHNRQNSLSYWFFCKNNNAVYKVNKPFDSSGLKKLFMIEGYSRSLGVNIKCQQRLTKNSRVVCTYFAALRIISFRFE